MQRKFQSQRYWTNLGLQMSSFVGCMIFCNSSLTHPECYPEKLWVIQSLNLLMFMHNLWANLCKRSLSHGCKFVFVFLMRFLFPLLFSLSSPLPLPFQASLQKLTWREINFEALQTSRHEGKWERGGKQQEMPVDEERLRKRLVTECFHATIKWILRKLLKSPRK